MSPANTTVAGSVVRISATKAATVAGDVRWPAASKCNRTMLDVSARRAGQDWAQISALEPWAPQLWHPAAVRASHTARPPQRRQGFVEMWAPQAVQSLRSRVRGAIFPSGARQTGQCLPPRRSFCGDVRRLLGRCRGVSSFSFTRQAYRGDSRYGGLAARGARQRCGSRLSSAMPGCEMRNSTSRRYSTGLTPLASHVATSA
jgi:hypothetical protein